MDRGGSHLRISLTTCGQHQPRRSRSAASIAQEVVLVLSAAFLIQLGLHGVTSLMAFLLGGRWSGAGSGSTLLLTLVPVTALGMAVLGQAIDAAMRRRRGRAAPHQPAASSAAAGSAAAAPAAAEAAALSTADALTGCRTAWRSSIGCRRCRTAPAMGIGCRGAARRSRGLQNRSTRPSAASPATSCCAMRVRGCSACCASPTCWRGWPPTSSQSCSTASSRRAARSSCASACWWRWPSRSSSAAELSQSAPGSASRSLPGDGADAGALQRAGAGAGPRQGRPAAAASASSRKTTDTEVRERKALERDLAARPRAGRAGARVPAAVRHPEPPDVRGRGAAALAAIPAHGRIAARSVHSAGRGHAGLIVPIGRWVLEQACRHAVAWQRQGAAELRVAVNLSPVQCRDPQPGRLRRRTPAAQRAVATPGSSWRSPSACCWRRANPDLEPLRALQTDGRADLARRLRGRPCLARLSATISL